MDEQREQSGVAKTQALASLPPCASDPARHLHPDWRISRDTQEASRFRCPDYDYYDDGASEEHRCHCDERADHDERASDDERADHDERASDDQSSSAHDHRSPGNDGAANDGTSLGTVGLLSEE